MSDQDNAAILRVKEAAERCTARGVDQKTRIVWETELLKELGVKKRLCHTCGKAKGPDHE